MKKLRKKGTALVLAAVLSASLVLPGIKCYANEDVETQAVKEIEQPETTVSETKISEEKKTETLEIPGTLEVPETSKALDAEPPVEEKLESSESEEGEEALVCVQAAAEVKSAVDEVKELIALLKGEPLNVTRSDRARIQAAGTAYNALSATEKAQIDKDQCLGTLADGVSTSQSYGRVLEACQWALRSLETPDTSTTLEEGTYTSKTDPAVSGTSDKGMSTSGRTRTWTIEQLIVNSSHAASARISVNSDSYDYIQCAGRIYRRLSDSASGTSCFLVPIDPNSTFYILGHSTVMPNSIAYKLTCSIKEPAVSDTVRVAFKVVNERGEMIGNAVVNVNSGNTEAEHGKYSFLKGAKYTVEVSADGYQSRTIEYTAAADEDYVITLAAADRLIVNAEDKDTGESIQASITVSIANGEDTAVEEYRTGEYFLTHGESYTITAAADGYKEEQMTITSDGDRTITIQLQKEGNSTNDSSQTVQTVIDMIAALPSEPTEADRAAIIEAQKAFIALDRSEESQVTNRERLEMICEKLGTKTADTGTYTFKDQSAGTEGGTYQAESIVTSSKGEAMFRVVNAVLRVAKNGSMTAEITLSGTGYRYLYMGTASDAFEAEEAAGGFKKCDQAKGIIKGTPVSYKDTDGKHSAYRFTIPVESLDHPMLIAAQSWAHDSTNADKTTEQRRVLQGDGSDSYTSIWFERAIILSSKQMVKVSSDSNANVETVQERQDGDDDNSSSSGSGSGSQKVGKYAFSWSGGSMGHVAIKCKGVEIRDGKAYVTITFVRKASVGGTAKFSKITVSGKTYSGNNVFTIPVNLNANTSIEAYTTAMSQGHWVHYTIYVGVNDPTILEQVGQAGDTAGEIESTVGEHTSEFDEEAPAIMGLKGGHEIEMKASRLLKIFAYDYGYYLIEVDLGIDPVAEEVAKKNEADTDSYSVIEEEAYMDNADSGDSKYRDESIGRAYQNRIVKYLVIPEEKEVPVGLEEMVVLVQEPVSNLYVSSLPALKLLDENGDTAKIASIGMEETDSLPESIVTRMEDTADASDRIEFFGTYDDWKLKKMIRNQTGFIIEDEQIIPQAGKDLETEMELYDKLTSRASQMGTAVFFDRSGSEEEEKAQEDWKTAYRILLGGAVQESK